MTYLHFPSILDNCNSLRSSSPAPVGPNEGFDSAAEASAVAASVFSSGRRVTRSQQGATNTAAKKYPLRQSRSSGSDTEANGERFTNVSLQCIRHCIRNTLNTLFIIKSRVSKTERKGWMIRNVWVNNRRSKWKMNSLRGENYVSSHFINLW